MERRGQNYEQDRARYMENPVTHPPAALASAQPQRSCFNDDCENMFEIGELLWGLAANAGFKRPADVAGKLKHKADFAPMVASA
jgi:hypothetical protein